MKIKLWCATLTLFGSLFSAQAAYAVDSETLKDMMEADGDNAESKPVIVIASLDES